MPEDRDSLISACHALANDGKWNEAIARLFRALHDSPGDILVAFALATILNRSGDYQRARELFSRIKAAAPNMTVAGLGLADSLIGLEEIDPALDILRTEALFAPQTADCYARLGSVHLKSGRTDASARHFRRAFVLAPGNIRSQTNLAEILSRTMAYDEAELLYQAALAQAPDDPEIRVNYGVHLIAKGHFEEGWRHFEARLDPRYESAPIRSTELPRWRGPEADRSRKHLLVMSEQGIGDELRLGGALPLLLDHFEAITVECDPRLTGLIERSLETVKAHGFVRRKQGTRAHYSYGWLPASGGPDCRLELGSIPYALGLKLAAPLNPKGYLQPRADLRERLAPRLADLAAGRKKVGIVWASGASNFDRSNNYPALSYWRQTLDLPDSCFFALQYGDALRQAAHLGREAGVLVNTLEDLDFRSDIEALAAVLAELDLVIGVGTATTALAGAVGTRTIELASALGWVPLLNGIDGYLGSVCCVAQQTLGDWSGPMARARELALEYLKNP